MDAILKDIEAKLHSQSLISLTQAKSEIDAKASGFYWIFTNKPIMSFLNCPKPINPKHVNFRYLSKIHKNQKYVISQQGNEEYWCIYNGKAKDLNNRIEAEFSATVFTKKSELSKTGKLALTRCFSSNDFKIKYIVCDAPRNSKGVTSVYECLEKDLERIWRLNNGWPIFCRH